MKKKLPKPQPSGQKPTEKRKQPRLPREAWYSVLVKFGAIRASVTNFMQCEAGSRSDDGLPAKAVKLPNPPAERIAEILDPIETDLMVIATALVAQARHDYPDFEPPASAKFTKSDKEARDAS